MKEFPKMQIIPLGLEDLHGQKIKIIVTGLQYPVKAKGQEFGGPIKIILQLKVIA